MKKLALNIGIDGNEANQLVRVGSGQYAFNVLKQLEKIDHTHNYYIFLKQPPQEDLPLSRPGWKYIVFGPQILWTRFALPLNLLVFSPKIDFFYSSGHYLPPILPCPGVVTIHDLGYLDTPEQFTKKDFYQLKNWTFQSILKAKKIIAVSNFTKQEIIKTYNINPHKIYIAPNGVEIPISPSEKEIVVVKNKFGIHGDYFINIGTLKPSKNIPFLINAYSQYLKKTIPNKQPLTLVIAGKKGWLFEEIFREVKKQNLESHVIFTNYISEREKWVLLKGATATIIPSLYEGFGIPAIESIGMNTPLIVSDIPPFREVLGKSAVFINPHQTESLVNAMLNPPTKSAHISKQWSTILKQYTWQQSAMSILNVFSKL